MLTNGLNIGLHKQTRIKKKKKKKKKIVHGVETNFPVKKKF